MIFALKVIVLGYKQFYMNIYLQEKRLKKLPKLIRVFPGKKFMQRLYINYLHNQETVSKYMEDWLEWGHQQRKAQQLNPHPSAERLRKIKAQIQAQLQNSKRLRKIKAQIQAQLQNSNSRWLFNNTSPDYYS